MEEEILVIEAKHVERASDRKKGSTAKELSLVFLTLGNELRLLVSEILKKKEMEWLKYYKERGGFSKIRSCRFSINQSWPFIPFLLFYFLLFK